MGASVPRVPPDAATSYAAIDQPRTSGTLAPTSENSFLRIAGSAQSGEQFGDLFRAPGFHRDIDGGLSQIYAVVGAVIGGFHDIRPMIRENSGKPVKRAGIVGKVDAQADQAAILHQAALDDARQQVHVDVAAADQDGNFFPDIWIL